MTLRVEKSTGWSTFLALRHAGRLQIGQARILVERHFHYHGIRRASAQPRGLGRVGQVRSEISGMFVVNFPRCPCF